MCAALVRLEGCSATPFGSYLKALGVLRLVSEQVDDEARGQWSGDIFVLNSRLDEQGLEQFFLEVYRPSPIVAPWNGGSGFYPKDNKEGIDAIAGTSGPRFAAYREVIQFCRSLPAVQRGKADAKSEDERRAEILLSCRNWLPDSAVNWLDAAVGIAADGSRAFAPVLGTGGNEGRLDYTNNFMSRVARLLVCPDRRTPVRDLLRHSLFAESTSGLQSEAAGQYDPGRAGGANQGQGIEQDSATNPWDFVLTLEGALAWASGLYRRQGISFRSYLCSPFTVRPSKVGYGSASTEEEARAEIWAPIWSGGARYREIQALMREGRATVDGAAAQNGLEFAEAATSLGVDRSIHRFVRYSLLKRRGDSYVALPAGVFPAHFRTESDRVRQIDGMLQELESSDIPKDCGVLIHRLQQAMYEALLRGGADRLREAVAAFGRVVRRIATASSARLPRPRSKGLEWLHACGMDCVEVRIAGALASLWDAEAGDLRRNLADPRSKDFAWQGRDLADRLLTVLDRRLRSYSYDGTSRPFDGKLRVSASDVTAFIFGSLDDTLIEDLLYAFVCFEWRDGGTLAGPEGAILPVYAALKFLFLPEPVAVDGGEDKRLYADARIPALLRASDVNRAVDLALHRLRVAGLRPVRGSFWGGVDGRRLGASLLIPARGFSAAILHDRTKSARA